MLDSFESISPTAILTSYPRIFTDIPYENEIYNWLKDNCNEEVQLNKMLAPELEARYKLTNKLLDSLNIKQVLEIAAGYSSRGLIYSNKDYNYVELDLEKVSRNKAKLLNSISKIPSNLHIISGNALKEDDFKKCDKYFDTTQELVIINEGLLRYLTFDEKRIVATNIYNMLKKYNGVWITCDASPKKFIQKQDECLKDFNENLNIVTSRNNLKDRFDDINQMKAFFEEIGFKRIEIHKFIEVKDEIKSFDILNINKSQYDELLENAIVTVLKV